MRALTDGPPPKPRSVLALATLATFALIAVGGFVALGLWQVERRAWKLDLIERVETRASAPAAPAPGPADWPMVTAERDQYRHISLTGVFDAEAETLVQAVTIYGPGFWVLTPLRAADGATILVNRGFVSPDMRDTARRPTPTGATTVTGLLRISEPNGAFLRANDPAADLWRSRDVAAIARARGLTQVAPYFVDADATPNPGGWPVGGLTVIAFRNSHLVYALTWFALAALVAIGAAVVTRYELRVRRGTVRAPDR